MFELDFQAQVCFGEIDSNWGCNSVSWRKHQFNLKDKLERFAVTQTNQWWIGRNPREMIEKTRDQQSTFLITAIMELVDRPTLYHVTVNTDAERKQTMSPIVVQWPNFNWLNGLSCKQNIPTYLFRSRSSITADKLHGTRETIALIFRDWRLIVGHFAVLLCSW